MPFVQGHLRREPVTTRCKTECAHCGEPLALQIDADLNVHVSPDRATPLVFLPIVDFAKLRAKSIIDDF